jgi:hypothetical protein
MSEETRRKIEQAPGRSDEGWLDRFAASYMSPIGISIALLMVLGGAWFLFGSGLVESEQPFVVQEGATAPVADTSTSTLPANFFNKASKNFDAILAGQLAVQRATESRGELEQYFREHGVGYAVQFADVKAPLAGGVISEHDGTDLAHLVYASGDTLVYIFEVPESILRKGDIVYVTEDVLQRLNAGETIWVEEAPRQSQVVFKKGDVVMTITANVPRPVLYGLLSMG